MTEHARSRRQTIATLLVIGAGLAILGLVNVWIGSDKAGDHGRSLAAIEERADDPTSDITSRDLENARGKRAFYLAVQQAGWWLVAGGLALSGVGLTATWLNDRGQARGAARRVAAASTSGHRSTLG